MIYHTDANTIEELAMHEALRDEVPHYFNVPPEAIGVTWIYVGEKKMLPYDSILEGVTGGNRRAFGVIEYKRRYCDRRDHEDWFVELAKVKGMAEFCRQQRCPGAFAVQLNTDGLGITPINVVVTCRRTKMLRKSRKGEKEQPGYGVPWYRLRWFDVMPPVLPADAKTNSNADWNRRNAAAAAAKPAAQPQRRTPATSLFPPAGKGDSHWDAHSRRKSGP